MDLRIQVIRQLEREKLERRFQKEDRRRQQAEERHKAYAAVREWEKNNDTSLLEGEVKKLEQELYFISLAKKNGTLESFEERLREVLPVIEAYADLYNRHQGILTRFPVTATSSCSEAITCRIRSLWEMYDDKRLEIERNIDFIKKHPPSNETVVKERIEELKRKIAAIKATCPTIESNGDFDEDKNPKKVSDWDGYEPFKYRCNCNTDWGCHCDAEACQRKYEKEFHERVAEKKRLRSKAKMDLRIAERIRQFQ